ncbi:uncharacterized protein LOC121692581 isoform X3 [Alosa sapidissima]|uniref:uncharacterized protein LOC121692581 isoform X1 n=1 Tax=Alosa sapidissima TaxID=34773 RepID=UPI001C08F30A|nr:uncharacterized protein LOC121692581 isoform X1 [Alosa sapidissima]XP_041927215.1 uncharacterized protein LOC121692581 isoform X3 [Alosa sapidissima]
MKMTLGNEMSIASASQMLRSLSSEKAVDPEVEKHGTVSSKEDNLSTSNSTFIDLDALAGFTKKVILKPTNVSTSKGVNTVAKVCPSLNDIALSCHQKNNYEDTLPYHKAKQSSSDGTVVQSQVDTMGEVTGAPSSLEVFKTEETQSVILQEAEVSSLEISSNEVETLAGASGALSGSSSPASSLDVFKTEEYLSVILQEAEVSTLEMSAEEVEMLAGASPALSGDSSSSSRLNVFKTEETQSVILQEAEVSTLEMSAEEVEMLAGASPALSGDSSSSSRLNVFKTEETQSVILQEAEVSSLEISSNEVETLAGASGALSGSSSPASSLDVFKTEEYLSVILQEAEEYLSVILQEAEVSTLEMSAEEVEMLAGASPALSGDSSSSSRLNVFKTEETQSVILQEAEVSTLEMSAEEIEMLAGASPALSGASSSSSSLEVFKTKQSRSVILQEATPEISSDEVKVLAGAISALSVTSSSPSNSQHSQSQEIQLNMPSFTFDSTGSDTNRVYTTTKTQSLPCLYPAIANEVSQYFTTTSFKDRITEAVKNELKRTFSVKELSSTPQPKLGPEDRRAIRTMLKTVSQELNDLMSRENILSLLSVEIAACGSPEHDVLLDQLNAAASQQIEAVFNTVKENLAAKINQESSKRGVSPLASQTAMKAVCKSLEDIKMTLIGDEMCVTSTSGIQLSAVSSEDTNVVPEMSSANNRFPEATPSTVSLSSQNSTSHAATVSRTPHAATKSLSLPNFYPIIANEVLQHISTPPFKEHVRQVLKKQYKMSRSMNDITSALQQKQGPEERHFTRDMLRSVSTELNASMSTQNVSMSPETPRPFSAPEDNTHQRLNAVALELINRVYGQVKEKLIATINQESPKRGLSPVASQTAVDAICRTLNVIEMTLMDWARSPSTSPSQLQKSKDLERGSASEETLEVENALSRIDVVTDDLIEDVISMFLDTDSALSSRTGTPTQRAGRGTWLNEVIKQSVSMSPTGSKAYITKSPDDTNVSLTLSCCPELQMKFWNIFPLHALKSALFSL